MSDSGINIRLKDLRRESKLTQEQLAEYLGVDQTLITRLENGSRNFTVSIIEKICDLFGCNENYLLGQSDEFIPLNFAFRSNTVQAEDLKSIAVVNKLALNLRYMNKKLGDE